MIPISSTTIVQDVQATSIAYGGVFHASALFLYPSLAGTREPGIAYGRGTSAANAKAGACAEAYERYSITFRGDETILRARLDQVPSISPNDLTLYSDSQYASREEWNERHEPMFWIAERFSAASQLDMLAGVDLLTGSLVFVPAACCLMAYPFREGEPQFSQADSNACGAGETLEQAMLSALLEAIERDAVAIWWYNRLQRPGIEVASLSYSPLTAIEGALRNVGRRLILLNLTNDIGIPVVAAITAREDGSEPFVMSAADGDLRLAAWKAASEVAQRWYFTTHESQATGQLKKWLDVASLSNQPYLCPEGFESGQAGGSQTELAFVIERLASCGLRPICVELSRKDVPVKVVRAIVPQLRHWVPRFAPGRLYDVPVQLGWIPTPLQERRLNPLPCCI